MRTHTTIGWSAAAAAAISISMVAPVNAAADDQALLDMAMESFNERMIDAGWVSQGPSDDAFESDGEEPSKDDEAINDCFGDLGAIFEGLDEDEFPGEIARSSSDGFTFTPLRAESSTTESTMFFPEEEEVAALAVSVDDAHSGLIGEFLDVLGARETSACMKTAMEAEMAADPDDTDAMDIALEFDVQAATQGDLGVGDHSALLTFGISMNMFGTPIDIAGTMAFASVDNHLVGVMHSISGATEPTSGFDVIDELRALVDSISS